MKPHGISWYSFVITSTIECRQFSCNIRQAWSATVKEWYKQHTEHKSYEGSKEYEKQIKTLRNVAKLF